VRGDGRAHACAAGAHYKDVVLTNHCKRKLPKLRPTPRQIRGPASASFWSSNRSKFSRNIVASSRALTS
jgi:hypothetical protein